MKVRHPGPVVAVAILLSLPMAPGILDGAIPPADALLRFLVALLLCWGGAALVGNVTTRYGEQARRAQVAHLMEQARHAAMNRSREESTGHTPTEPPPLV